MPAIRCAGCYLTLVYVELQNRTTFGERASTVQLSFRLVLA